MSNSGNLSGRAPTNAKPPLEVVMAAFDVLPKPVREKVAYAALDWDTTAIYRNLREGRATADRVIALIDDYERQYCRGPL